jgi:predicted Zn-dependent protease
VLLVAGVARSAERHRAWRDEATFVARIVADSPRSWRAQRAHGQLLFESGNRDQEAVHAYRRAIALAPASHVWRVRNDLARRFWEIGANELAVVELRASLSEGPGQRETSYYLIVGYMTVGAYADAIREADSAMARGHSSAVFGELRALADAARRVGAPPGSLGIRVGTGKPPW